jgi:hypothetical protein
MKRFDKRMESHDKRVEERIKALDKAAKKIEGSEDVSEAEVNQRIDYQIGVTPEGVVYLRFTANQKPIKLSTMSFDVNGAMALANNLVKVVKSYQAQLQQTGPLQ